MSASPFIPRVYSGSPSTPEVTPSVPPPESTESKQADRVGHMILRAEQYCVVGLLFLLPLFFIPGLPATLGFDKAILASVGGLVVVIFLALSSLRYTKVTTVLPYALWAFWGLVAIAFLSGLLSGDIQDALRGSYVEPQSAAFLAIMGLMMTVPLVLQRSKVMSLKTLIALGAASTVALLYTFIRLFVGGTALGLKSFGSITTSPIGSFNDLAIFAGLTILISLITLLQLPLKRSMQWALSVLILLSLTIMMLVNFFNLWIVIGFFGILLLVYIFSRDTLFGRVEGDHTVISPVTILSTMVVCLVCILFVTAGDYLSTHITNLTGVNYLEVRPSMTATIDIARGVYHDDVLLGIGPNKFVDAWRLFKDRAINETIFWNTNFTAGFGFVPTLFVTLGVIGGLGIVVFHLLYLYLGYRMLLRGNAADPFWYYFGLVTFVGAGFLWGMSYVYVSGPTILLLAALLTGLSFVAYQALVPTEAITIPLVSTRRRGFFLMTIVILLITASVAALFTLGKQYVAQAEFTHARNTATTPDEFEQNVQMAFEQYKDDSFAGSVAQARLLKLRELLSRKDPTKEDQTAFINTARAAVGAAEEAIRLDPTNPEGHATLANIFILLSGVGFEDAENRANGKLEDARWRDPLNPSYDMMAAYMAVQLNDSTMAREKINKALSLKNNFSEALLLLAQLDVKDGNLQSAIDTTRQIITLEPNNATRYYQLGVLLAANKDTSGAVEAYQSALSLDANYANARYMLALTYLDAKELDKALEQLRIVQKTNADNEQLKNLITQLETNGLPLVPTTGLEGSVNEATPNQTNGETVTSPTDPKTNLVSPVNAVNNNEATAE